MQPEKPGHQRLRVLFQMAKIPFQKPPHLIKLLLTNGLNEILAILRVIKEGPTLALTDQLLKGSHPAHNQGGHHSVRPNTVYILLVFDLVHASDVVEDVGRVVGKCVEDVVLAEMSVVHLEGVL